MTHQLTTKPINILLVEDNPGDVRLTQEALKDAKMGSTLHVVKDGVQALAFLRRQDGHADAPRPDLILLDLNLPRKNGHEVLAEIKDHPHFRCIPVVILTVSQDDRDIVKTYDLHANCYISKPADLDQFITVVKSIQDFWLTIASLPPNEALC